VVKQPDKNSQLLTATYECVEKHCGFKIAADDPHCSTYIKILDDLKDYLFFLKLDKCECGHKTNAIVDRVTVGAGVSDPTKERSIDLNNELQLLFVCSQGKCSYRKSIPQIRQSCHERIRCICTGSIVYNPETRVFSCPVLSKGGGGCGVCFHEMDLLTYAHMEQARTVCEDHVWLSLSNKARRPCHDKPGILKYRLEEGNMRGKLIYECALNNSCRQILRNILSPTLLYNNTVI
jgi:hypothetical protein